MSKIKDGQLTESENGTETKLTVEEEIKKLRNENTKLRAALTEVSPILTPLFRLKRNQYQIRTLPITHTVLSARLLR